MKTFVFTFVTLMLLASCSTNSSSPSEVKKKNESPTAVAMQSNDKGMALAEKYCLACHTLKPARGKVEGLAAPPFPGVVMHYKKAYPKKEDFIKAFVNYVPKPDSAKSVMPGAIERFGLMPPMPIPEDSVRLIAATLYDRFGHMKHNRRRGMHGKHRK